MENYLDTYFEYLENSIISIHKIILEYIEYPMDYILFFIIGFLLFYLLSFFTNEKSNNFIYNEKIKVSTNKTTANNVKNLDLSSLLLLEKKVDNIVSLDSTSSNQSTKKDVNNLSLKVKDIISQIDIYSQNLKCGHENLIEYYDTILTSQNELYNELNQKTKKN